MRFSDLIRMWNRWLIAGTAMLLLPLSLSAQTGSIAGTVTDPSGAVVPQTKINIRNLATNAVRSAETGSSGTYTVPNLPAGTYEVTFEKSGFRALQYSDIVVTVAEVVSLNPQFSLGPVSETVEVSGSLQKPIELETSQVSNIVDSSRIQNLPLLTRNPYELVLLSPGTMQSNSALGGFSVNGSRERNNNFLLDGTDNNDTSVPGIAGGLIDLNPEATREFRVITNNYLPEFGRNTGAIIDIASKSGGNDFHGDAYWFGRYNALGARDSFNPSPDRQNPYVRNQFGFSLGGPVVRDKTFFFFNNEFKRYRTTLTNFSIVPTAAFRSGMFTYTDPVNGPINVNLANSADPSNLTGLGLNPTTQSILSLFPEPNGALVDETRGGFFFPSRSAQDSYGLTTKVDHNFTANNALSLRYSYNTLEDPNPFHSEFLPGLDTISTNTSTHGISATLRNIFGTSRVNELKAGFNRLDASFQCGGLNALNGIGGLDQFGRGRDFALPGIAGFGCLTLGSSDGQARRTGTYSLADNFTWVKGSHTMKFGSEFRFVFEDGFNSFFSRDLVTFNPFSNFGIPSIDGVTSSTVQDMGWMLVGLADTQFQSQFFNKAGVRTATDNRRFRQREYGFYAQDSWKARSNLTFNFGLRYQFNGVPYERDGNFSNLFVDPSGPAPFTFNLVGPGSGRLLYNNDFSNWEPRVGFAWDPFGSGRTSVRGAYGIFHDRVFGNLFGNARGNPPFQQDFFALPLDLVENVPFPANQAPSAVVQDGAGIFPILLDPDLKMPYTQNWNFGIQRELTRDLVVEMNYVGSKGTHGLRVVDGNPPNPAIVQQLLNQGVPPSQLTFANLWFGNFPVSPVGNNAFFQAAMNRSLVGSTYHSFQTQVTRRMSHGFQIQGAYTWSHSIDDGSDPLVQAAGARGFPRNSLNLSAERGNSGFDLRHRMVLNYIWELPFGKNRALFSNGVMSRILGGLQLSGITTAQSGLPFEVFGNRDSQHTGLSDRAFQISNDLSGFANCPSYSSDIANQTFTGVNVCAFSNPPFNSASNVGRNKFYGPNFVNFDAALAKRISITERVKLEPRLEVFNVFNHPLFAQPGNLIGNPGTFGVSTATITRPDGTTSARQMQFAVKLSF